MARIDLDLAHSYKPLPTRDADYALLPLTMTFDDGGAYALLGPSGCGKTTMLNIISGLVAPSQGTVRFDGEDVTSRTPQQRNIAQVFQFPVIYDTMTVAENLAFPLRNRRMPAERIGKRVGVVAEMLELTAQLPQRAAGLSADVKQKISLGRGLVRNDVSAVLFDEPLTVIDPHLKWQLRRKLKQIHRELKLTLIYVTHDQVEALTFADQVIVMTHGRAVQTGSADQLFERPQHTFVGHFIGSPGMNFLDAEIQGDRLRIDGVDLHDASGQHRRAVAGRTRDARRAPRIRYRFRFGTPGCDVRARGQGPGYRHPLDGHGQNRRSRGAGARLVRRSGARRWRHRVAGVDRTAHVLLQRRQVARVKPVNHKAWLLILPVVVCVAFSAILPLMTVVNYSVQDIISPERRVFVGTEWFKMVMRDGELHDALLRQITFSVAVLVVEVPLGIMLALSMPPSGWKASAVLVLLAMSLLIPWNVVGTIWQIFGRTDIGLFGAALARLGFDYNYTGSATDAWLTVLLMDVWHWTSLVALLCYAGLRAIPNAYYQAAQIDGASRFAVFRYIELPKLRGVLMIAVLLRFMDSFMIYTEPFVLTGGGPGNSTTFLSQYLTQKAVGQFDVGPAAAFSLIYFLIILLMCFILYNWMQRVGTSDASTPPNG